MQTVLSIIMDYLDIFLALKTPKIVNLQGQGMFDFVCRRGAGGDCRRGAGSDYRGGTGGDQGGSGDPGSGVSPSTAGGATSLRGFARSSGAVVRRAARGGYDGYRRGQEANGRIANVLGGNFLYRGHSKRDDAAYDVDRQRQELNRNFDRLIKAVGGEEEPKDGKTVR